MVPFLFCCRHRLFTTPLVIRLDIDFGGLRHTPMDSSTVLYVCFSCSKCIIVIYDLSTPVLPSLLQPLHATTFGSTHIFYTTLSRRILHARLYVRPIQHRFPCARAHLSGGSVGWPRLDLLEEGKIYVWGKSVETCRRGCLISRCLT